MSLLKVLDSLAAASSIARPDDCFVVCFSYLLPTASFSSIVSRRLPLLLQPVGIFSNMSFS